MLPRSPRVRQHCFSGYSDYSLNYSLNKIFLKNLSNFLFIANGDKIDIFLNGLESGQIKKVKMENNVFGILVEGKQKVAVPAFIFAMPDRNGEDTEVSTEVD